MDYMEILNNLGNLIRDTLNNCYKDSKLKKYLLFSILLQAGILGVTFIFGVTIGDTLSSNPDQLASALPSLILMLMIYFGSITIFLLGYFIITYLTINRSLEIVKRKTIPIGVINFVKFCFMYLFYLIAAVLSLFNLKFLLIPIAGIIVLIIGIFLSILNPLLGILLSLFSMFFFLAYYIVVIYNMFRLYFIEPVFLETGEMIDSLKLSWKITKGKVADLFIVMVFIIFAFLILTFIFDLPATIYSVSVIIGTGMSSTGIDQANIALSADPIYILLQLPNAILMGMYIIFINNFLVVIYDFISKKKKSKK